MTAPCTNNLVEYEAMRRGMELLLEAGAEAVEIFGDSKIVISQLTEEYRCESEALFPIWMQCRDVTPRPTDSTREFENLSDEAEELCSNSFFPDLCNTYLELSAVMHVQCCLNRIKP